MLAALALALVAASPASAEWARVSRRRSTVQPYYVCAKRARGARCAAIRDPARGSSARGPVAAGAITAGPAQEASPALQGGGVEGGFAPAELRAAYDLPSTTAGAGQTIAVVDAFNDPDAESDLAKYRSRYSLAECTSANKCFRKVNEDGEEAARALPPGEPNWGEEISLDLDMVSAICPNCHILLVEAANEEIPSLAAAENEAAKLGATEISNSYAEPLLKDPEYDYAYDHLGIPITAAAGDQGYKVEWPAASPNVIAVGGTSLEKATGARGWKEAVWYGKEGSETYGTGSGCSEEPKPRWQTDSGCLYRTNNDVAAVADQNTPVSVYDSYKTKGGPWLLMGGTSVATPIIAGAMALATPYTRTFEGAKALYAEAALNGTGVLDNVTVGKNGNCGDYLCEAGVGYNGPTGLGSLWGAPNVPAPAFTTEAASSVTATEAKLTATIEPNDAEVECSFEYGTGGSLGLSAPCSTTHVSGTTSVAVSVSLSGLEPASTYHFRVAGAYSDGPGHGIELTFKTQEAAPSATTVQASAVTQASATLNATVDPNGGTTSCLFEYEPATSGSTIPCTPEPGSGQATVPVSANLGDLAPDTTYRYRVVAHNSAGTTHGPWKEFRTLPIFITSIGSADVEQETATVNAEIDPDGIKVESCSFEYGTSSFTEHASCEPSPGDGGTPVAVTAQLEGLAPGGTYRFRVAVTAAGDAERSTEATFTTLPDAPSVSSDAASSIGEGTATANAMVNADGAELTSCLFQYRTVEAGATETVPCSYLPGPGEGPRAVSARLVGLIASTGYEYRVVASNAGGTSYGGYSRFTTVLSTSLKQTGPGESGLEAPGPGAVSLASTTLEETRTGLVTAKLRCRGTAVCKGTLTLTTLRVLAAINAHGPKHVATLASGTFSVPAGHETGIKLRIDPTGRRLLLLSRTLRARATITMADSKKDEQATVTIRAPRTS